MDVPSDHNEPPINPVCRGCHVVEFTTKLRVTKDIHPDCVLLLCDECTDFVLEVMDTIEKLDSRIGWHGGMVE